MWQLWLVFTFRGFGENFKRPANIENSAQNFESSGYTPSWLHSIAFKCIAWNNNSYSVHTALSRDIPVGLGKACGSLRPLPAGNDSATVLGTISTEINNRPPGTRLRRSSRYVIYRDRQYFLQTHVSKLWISRVCQSRFSLATRRLLKVYCMDGHG